MELYILNDNFQRTDVVDKFESLVWTERFQAHGDFELTLYSSRDVRSLFTYGTKVATNKSFRVMIVDELENKSDADGRKILTIKGNSIEKILKDRVVSHSATAGVTNLTSTSKGTATMSATTDLVTNVGHGLLTGDFVYFKTTGKLASYSLGNVPSTKVNITDNTLKLDNHGLNTGDEVFVTTSGTMPTGLVTGASYYAIMVNSNIIKLATTAANADVETAIDITAAGSGTHTLHARLKQDYGYCVIKVSDDTFKLATNADNAEINVPIDLTLVTGGGSGSAQTGIHTLYWYNFGKIRVSGLPADIAKTIFQTYCINGFLSSTDIIPNITIGDVYLPGSIPAPDTTMTMDVKITSVYEVTKQICELYGMGFRIVRNPVTNALYYNIYTGDDKTTTQTTYDPVVFDASLDTLLSDTEYISTKNLKNVAYVFSPNGFAIVYAGIADANTAGLDKKVLYVDASDIQTSPGVTLNNQLASRGQQALAEYRTMLAFDGEVPTFGNYIYDLDYKLGDLVEVRNSDGYSDHKRVTEQIFSDDAQGEKSYPTLSSELVITPGSWMAWDNSQTWDDVPNDLDHEWQDL